VICARVRAHLGDHLEGDLDLRTRVSVDAHLAACEDCAKELRELRSTIALVRSLPAPQPEPGIADAVMERIDAGEGRTARRLPVAISWVFDPRVAVPLAAGIAGLVVLVSMENGPPGVPTPVVPEASDELAARLWDGNQGRGASRRRIGPRLLAIERTAANRFYQPDPRPAVVGFFGDVPDLHQLDLDAEIDRAKVDPEEFLERVNQINEVERRSRVAPLAVRAGRRGDSQAVARYLRSSAHPLAASVASQFEGSQRERRQHRSVTVPVVVPASYP
jgi:hypothetical protein